MAPATIPKETHAKVLSTLEELQRVVVGAVVAGSPSQKQSKVGQMVGLTTKLIVPVPEMKTLVFAFPFL